MIDLKNYFSTQPPRGVQVNYAEPLARQLRSLILMNNGGGVPFDMVKARQIGDGFNGWADCRSGKACAGWSIKRNNNDKDLEFVSGPWTIATFFNIKQFVSGEYLDIFAIDGYSDESTNKGWGLTTRGDTDKFAFLSMNNNGSANYRLESNTLVASGNWSLVGTSDGITRRLYVNGKQETTTTTNANPATALGVSIGNSTGNYKCHNYICVAWARELSADEISKWHRNPFGLLYIPSTIYLNRIVDSNVTIQAPALTLSMSVEAPIPQVTKLPDPLTLNSQLGQTTPVVSKAGSALTFNATVTTPIPKAIFNPSALTLNLILTNFVIDTGTPTTTVQIPALTMSMVLPTTGKNITVSPNALSLQAILNTAVPKITVSPEALKIISTLNSIEKIVGFSATAQQMSLRLSDHNKSISIPISALYLEALLTSLSVSGDAIKTKRRGPKAVYFNNPLKIILQSNHPKLFKNPSDVKISNPEI